MQEMTEEKRCAHGVCNCLAEAKSDFCSPYCAEASAGEMVQLCDCGHPGCVG